MDRVLNPELEEDSIYEIYRACRLCGAGAGYKMPIVQNVVGLDDLELKLSQKIRECVQIEVHPDDKMPPLICELCVDKVNDFYEFLEMCRQTNKRTRLKLGLPLVSTPRVVPEPTDCILGDTGPVFINSDSDGEPLVKHKRKTTDKIRDKSTDKSKDRSTDKTRDKSRDKSKNKHSKLKKELGDSIKVENITSADLRGSRSVRARRPLPLPPGSPPPAPRVTRTGAAVELHTNRYQDTPKMSKSTSHAPIKLTIKKEKEEKAEDEKSSRSKRSREKEVKPDVPMKKAKSSLKPRPSSIKPLKPSRSRVSPSPPAQWTCIVCGHRTHTGQGHSNHMRTHTVTFTNPELACDPCGEWFPSARAWQAHHRAHAARAYRCRRCTAPFPSLADYTEHLARSCIPYDEVPDVRCGECWRHFATDALLIHHECAGRGGRPGGKCPKCNRTYVLLKNLIRHESVCLHRKRDQCNIDPKLKAKLKPLRVLVARCDPLLKRNQWGRYDVSQVSNFGFDENSYYPYWPGQIKIKSEPFDGMVKINEEIEKEFLSDDSYIHWDTDSDTDGTDKMPKLATLAIRTIFSPKCLGKVPKKKRKIEYEPASSPTVNEDVTNSASATDKIVDTVSGATDSLSDKVNEISDMLVSTEDSSKNDGLNVGHISSIHSIDSSDDNVGEGWKFDTTIAGVTENIKISKVETLRDVNNGKIDTENGYKDKTSEIDETMKENGLNNFMEKFNGNDDFDSEIDGDKLIAALNAQIGEDDDDDVTDEKQNDKDYEQKVEDESMDGKKCESVIVNGKDDKTHKLSLDELLAKDSKEDMNSITDEDFNFDV